MFFLLLTRNSARCKLRNDQYNDNGVVLKIQSFAGIFIPRPAGAARTQPTRKVALTGGATPEARALCVGCDGRVSIWNQRLSGSAVVISGARS